MTGYQAFEYILHVRYHQILIKKSFSLYASFDFKRKYQGLCTLDNNGSGEAHFYCYYI